LPPVARRSGPASYPANPEKDPELIDPASLCQDWSSDSETFVCPPRPELAPQHVSQCVDASEHSAESSQDTNWALSMDDATMEDIDLLCPVDSVSPLSDRDFTAPKPDRSRGNSDDRKRGPEPVETSRLAWRRAKNRTAASKCRAKQKDRTKALQEEYEESSARNAYLKRQERVLKGLITSLRDCALQHDSARCRCKVLHAFNMRRAEQISRSMS
jgi:hypothetical protein